MSGRNKRAALATLAELRAERDARWQRMIERENWPRNAGLAKYVLDGREIIRAPFDEWAIWFEHAHDTGVLIVRQDRLRGRFVSTVFLGIDHSSGEGDPLLFETMIFDEADEGTSRQGRALAECRWSTYAEAELGHAFALYCVQTGVPFEPFSEVVN